LTSHVTRMNESRNTGVRIPKGVGARPIITLDTHHLPLTMMKTMTTLLMKVMIANQPVVAVAMH